MEFVIISGMSGAGKSRAASFLEDMGFFVVDNLPAPLIPKFADLAMAGSGEYDCVGLVSDVRGGADFRGLFQALDALDEMNCPYHILFMDARDDVIVNRYKETRRMHPLGDRADSLTQAIAMERQALEELRQRAHYTIDTSGQPTARLRGELKRLFGRAGTYNSEMVVRVSSFGFKHGIPTDVDLVFDVRFLPNPYYVAELRPQTGLVPAVADYVFAGGRGEEFLQQLNQMLAWLVPQYMIEGRSTLSIAIGCTGGRHRSVAIAHAVAQFLTEKHPSVVESHRDLGKN